MLKLQGFHITDEGSKLRGAKDIPYMLLYRNQNHIEAPLKIPTIQVLEEQSAAVCSVPCSYRGRTMKLKHWPKIVFEVSYLYMRSLLADK